MSEATARAGIKTILESVTNVGQVHDYERWSSTWDVFLEKFKSTISGQNVIRGWTIAMTQAELGELPYDSDPDAPMFMVTYTYTIRGYFGVKDADATEKTALVVVQDVLGALIAGADDIATDVLAAPLPQLEAFDYRLIGGVLVHYAEIRQQVQIITRASAL